MILDGCRREPLGSYLQALGAWSTVVRLLDPEARGCWAGDRFDLDCSLGRDGLVPALVGRFEPLPIVSPWNSGSGFAASGKSPKAEQTLMEVRESSDPRLQPLQSAVLAADRAVELGRAAGWGGKKGEFWDGDHKADLILACRNLLPDEALAWLDATIALGQDHHGQLHLNYSRLLGTGGVFGRQDLQVTYMQRALTVLADKARNQSAGWLRAAMFGDESTPYLRDTVGQFDPGRSGGIHSSPREKADEKGFVNPWAFLFTIEGALLFASATTRRQGALNADAALPFMVRGSGVGFASNAADENVLGEIWAPEWDRPAALSEVQRLLGEGRADWNGRPATTGLDFVQAVSSLGVDRGIRRFTRHLFVDRRGQSPLALSVGVVGVQQQPETRLLANLDMWLSQLRRMSLPATVATRLRLADHAVYDVARGSTPEAVRGLLSAVGSLHEAVSRSGAVRERVRPLSLGNADDWWSAVQTGEPEQRAAAVLASGHDKAEDAGIRALLTPVLVEGHRIDWSNHPPRIGSASGMVTALAAAHRRRAQPGVVGDPSRDRDEGKSELQPAVQGVFSAFRRGLEIPLSDLVDLVSGVGFDDEQLREDLSGLLLLDWSSVVPAQSSPPSRAGRVPPVLPPLLALLLPFYSSRPLRVRLREEDQVDTQLVLRPGAGWLPWLHAGATDRVARDAVARLRAAGVQGVIDPHHVGAGVDGDRISAALLLRVSPTTRLTALRRVAVLPRAPASEKATSEGVLL